LKRSIKNREASIKCANEKNQFFLHNKFQDSKLKYGKKLLRNLITRYHLESCILMSVEKDILTSKY